MSFRGVSEHTIDAKGRTSVPARFRDVLNANFGEKLIVTTGFDHSLHVYPLRNWEAFEAKLAGRSPSEPGVKQIFRTYIANATDCEIDKLGRILLAPNLRTWAELEKDVVWVGQVRRMELWSKPSWARVSSEALSDEHSEAITRVLSEIGG